jgi:uncharacterized protein YbjT (DUF2867 family)
VNDETPSAPHRVFVTGASGFIGTHFCRRLTAAGYDVTALVRKPPQAGDELPDVRYVVGDVRDISSLTPESFAACDAVLHLVGIITEIRGKGQTFPRIHVDGTRNVLAAAQKGASRPLHVLYLSAQGASLTSPSEYSRTKAAAETLVQESGLPYTIFRPSLVLGKGAEFLKQMEGLIRRPPLTPFPLPFVPVPGNGRNRFQPVYVDDLADAVLASLTNPASRSQILPIGGADIVTFDELLNAIQKHLGTNKPLFHAPMPLMFAAASVLEALLPRAPVTVDQLHNLRVDNVCDNTGIAEILHIQPMAFVEALARCYEAG